MAYYDLLMMSVLQVCSVFSEQPADLLSCPSGGAMVAFNPTHEVLEGVDVVWQIPPNPKAVLCLVHSANGTPFSYWPSHPNVPECTGTPEHVMMTRDALERGFAVIALKSVTSEWQPWPASSVDVQNGVKILKAWTTEHGLQDLPLSALGTSIGGAYVSTLATVVKMHTLIVMISHGIIDNFQSAVPGEFPATLFVPMIKDEEKVVVVNEYADILRSKGIPCDVQGAPPLKLHPHFFAENIDELDKEQSAKLYSVFLEDGVIDKDNNVDKVVFKRDMEPYLRKAGILPSGDDAQPQQDEDISDKDKSSKQAGGGRGGGRGPPSTRGEAPPVGVPPSQRGEGPPAGRRGGGGPRQGGGGPKASHLCNGVSNQLLVAQGKHTLTSRHNARVFDWMEGKGWPNYAQSQ